MDRYTKEDYEREKKQLKKVNPLMIIDYIQTTIEILMSHKPEPNDNKPSSKPYDYETLLRQMEGESREHIAVLTVLIVV